MGKKNRKPGPGQVQHREIYQRMNFLYQAATLMTTTITSNTNDNRKRGRHSVISDRNMSSGTDFDNNDTSNGKGGGSDKSDGLIPLGRFYVNTMKTIGTKQVLRIDPSIKRNLCRRCDTLLLPGVTSQVRMKCEFRFTIHYSPIVFYLFF